MTDPTHGPGSPDDLRDAQALLFAGGLLDGAEVDAFEARLGEDQAAREALCQAVQLLRPDAAGPDPAYRRRVARRLRRSRGPLAWLLRERTFRGHPLLWGVLGAAAAVLLTVGLLQLGPADSPDGAPAAPRGEQAAAPAADGPEAPAPEAERAAQAQVWAGQPRNDHLRKTHDEESRRKTRSERMSRLPRVDERNKGRGGEAGPPRR